MYSEQQLVEQLIEYRKMPTETEWLEFKEAKKNYDFDDLGKYVSALSNEANLKHKHSGWLIFGIKDKQPRDIVGTHYRENPAELDSLKHEIAKQTNGITFQEIYPLRLPEGRVLMFQIPAAPAGIPTSWKGHFYGRDGESLVALSLQELETIRNHASSMDWSAQICPDASIYDLDEEALRIARTKFQAKHPQPRFGEEMEKWDIITFLDKAKLIRNGKITRTTILLLGKPEAAHHLSPHLAQISWKLDAEEKAYAHFGPPFLLSVEEVFRQIRNLRFRFQPFNQLIPIELTKYDSKIVLEALNNCIAHQDYTQNARIIVTEKVDYLTLQNIGGFYDGTVEDYLLHERTPERYRNPFLIQAMVNLDMIDTMGMGIRRMFMGQWKRYFPLPEYDLSDRNHVRITIYGKLIDENYSRMLMEKEDLSLPEVIALDRIQKKQKVSKETVRELKKSNLIEGRYPNIFVSAHIAAAANTRAQYIKNRAFDDDHYEKLILTFLSKYESASRQDIDDLVVDKLPEVLSESQKKNKISNLLGRMKREGLIENQGSDRKPKWACKQNTRL